MAENYIMINDIMAEHKARMQNLRKYYPFFVLNENTFTQYKEGRYSGLDMGYITMATLRFFINENQFNQQAITYASYASFLQELLQRDFMLSLEEEEGKELIAYIFDKLLNGGRPFEFPFFDPEEHKQKRARVKLIDSVVEEGIVAYQITPEGIEFYLDTKEVKDESKISVQQLLLEKMIHAKNFKGGIDVVRRINSEVKRLSLQKEQVIALLGHDVFEGALACQEYMKTVSRWFDEEQKLFERNKALIEQTLSRATLEGAGKREAVAFYRSLEEINKLETELKRTIHQHGELIRETTRLQDLADKMIHQAKLKRLRNVFDFSGALNKLEKYDDPDGLTQLMAPFFMPRIRKEFSLVEIDKLLTYPKEGKEQGERVMTQRVDRDYVYPDQLEEQRIARNYKKIFMELVDQIRRKGRTDLMEFNEIMRIRFGPEILINGDYYGFMAHLSQKKHYALSKLMEQPETFLENILVEQLTADELGEDMAFHITFTGEDIHSGQEGFYMMNMEFTRGENHG